MGVTLTFSPEEFDTLEDDLPENKILKVRNFWVAQAPLAGDFFMDIFERGDLFYLCEAWTRLRWGQHLFSTGMPAIPHLCSPICKIPLDFPPSPGSSFSKSNLLWVWVDKLIGRIKQYARDSMFGFSFLKEFPFKGRCLSCPAPRHQRRYGFRVFLLPQIRNFVQSFSSLPLEEQASTLEQLDPQNCFHVCFAALFLFCCCPVLFCQVKWVQRALVVYFCRLVRFYVSPCSPCCRSNFLLSLFKLTQTREFIFFFPLQNIGFERAQALILAAGPGKRGVLGKRISSGPASGTKKRDI